MRIALTPNPDFKPPKEVSLCILGTPDIQLLADHLTGLDAQARHDRFNGATDTQTIEDYAKRCIQPGVMVIAAMHDGQVIGIAELHPASIDAAEAAFSVNEDWRGKGIGAALFALILEAAWSRGLSELDISTHAGNKAMKRLARKFDVELRFDHGEGFGRIDLRDIRLPEG